MTEYEVEEIENVISTGIECAQRLIDRWESGNDSTLRGMGLAEAMSMLEDWAVKAAEYLPDVCKRCGVKMQGGVALKDRYTPGVPDFMHQEDTRGQTMVLSGYADLIAVSKCPECGYSRS